MKPGDAIAWHRTIAANCDRAATWLDDLADGRAVTDTGPIPLHLARHVPPRLLRAWANNERANRIRHHQAANDLVLNRNETRRKNP